MSCWRMVLWWIWVFHSHDTIWAEVVSSMWTFCGKNPLWSSSVPWITSWLLPHNSFSRIFIAILALCNLECSGSSIWEQTEFGNFTEAGVTSIVFVHVSYRSLTKSSNFLCVCVSAQESRNKPCLAVLISTLIPERARFTETNVMQYDKQELSILKKTFLSLALLYEQGNLWINLGNWPCHIQFGPWNITPCLDVSVFELFYNITCYLL